MNEARREQLLKTPLPTTVTMLQKALGAFSYVQRWIPGMADIAQPLYQLLDKDGKKELKWTPTTRAAFEKLKEQVVNPPALYLPDFTRPFVLVTDASGLGTGAMLAQRDHLQQEGPLRPIAFFHHTLSTSERNYSTTDRELLAVVLAVKKFRVYLAGKRFDLITDHRALAWINESLDLHDVQGRRGRWLEFLQQYPFNPVHRAGKSPELAMADYLSRVGHGEQVASLRLANLATNQAESDGAYRLFPILSEKDIRDAQKSCPAVGEYLAACERQRTNEWCDNEAKTLWQARDRLMISPDGILRYRNYKGRSTDHNPLGKNCQLLVVLPQSLRRRLLKLVHDSPLGGHMGRDRTWDRIRTMVWWPGIQSDVAKYVAGCDLCQRVKHHRRGKAPLTKTEIPNRPFQRIQIDFVGPVQASVPEGFTYVLAMQDVLTRYVKLVATLDNSAETAVRVLIDEWITQFDLPEVIGSDQGTHFTAIVFETVCKELGIEHARGSPEHAQSQGQVERQNQLFANIRAVCNRNPASWPRAMHVVTFAHNTSINKTTGLTPHELVFKQQARRPETFLLPEDTGGEDEEWVPETPREISIAGQSRSDVKKLDDVFQLVKRRISLEQDKRGQRTKVTMKQPFEIGQRVRTRLTPKERNKNGGKKLADLKSKEYTVIGRKGNTYKLRASDNPNERIRQRHYNELEAAPRQTLSWETDSTDNPTDDSDSETEEVPLRRSQRRNRAPLRLQVDGHQKRYSQHEVIVTDIDESVDEY